MHFPAFIILHLVINGLVINIKTQASSKTLFEADNSTNQPSDDVTLQVTANQNSTYSLENQNSGPMTAAESSNISTNRSELPREIIPTGNSNFNSTASPVTLKQDEILTLPDSPTTTVKPTFEIRTMIEELPPWITDTGVAVDVEEPPGIDMSVPVQMYTPNVFDDVSGANNMVFEEQIIYIEERACGTVCGVTKFPSDSTPIVTKSNCQPCFCDQACVTLHNCCPDVILRNMTSHDTGQGSECVETIPTGVNISEAKKKDFISMITKCADLIKKTDEQDQNDKGNSKSSSVSHDIIKSKCEHLNISDIQQAVPVSVTTTKLTYRNAFCAQCNGINVTDRSNLQKWSSHVECDAGMGILLSGNPNSAELYRRLTSKKEVARAGCRMRYTTKVLDTSKECSYLTQPIIERCNQTGKWEHYDARIEHACGLYSSIVFNKYKNLFCFICNTDGFFQLATLVNTINTGGDQANSARISFQALMDFSDLNSEPKEEDKVENVVCSSKQIYDNFTCQCVDVRCSQGKELSYGNTTECTSIISSNLLGYRICFNLDLVFNDTVPVPHIDELVQHISRHLMFCCFRDTPLEARTSVKSWCPGNPNITVNIEFYYIGSYGLHFTVNELDSRALQIITSLKQYSERWLPQGLKSHRIFLDDSCIQDMIPTKPCRSTSNLEVNSDRKFFPFIGSVKDFEKNVMYIRFRNTNLCSHIDLPAEEFEFDTLGESFVHKASQLKIKNEKLDYIDNVTVRVCSEYYQMMMKNSGESKNCNAQRSISDSDNFDTWTVSGIVSIVSTCLSLLCLFLTFLTHVIFRNLRDGSGKNIMTLTVTLFVAQALFEFAVEQFEDKTTCTIFGILIHYFWLTAVFSMNACTVERFYMLCFPLKSRPLSYSKKPFIVASLYTFISPSIIVALNISVMLKVTGEIGYGNSRVCYINNVYSRAFSFALPVALLIVTNLILFICTIVFLRHRSTHGLKSSATKIGIVACVRLSFVTGLMWSLAFLYEFVTFDSLGYVLTALIGLQGVLFFYSIIVNRKVFALYKGLLSQKSKNSSTNKNSRNSNSNERADKTGVYVIRDQKHSHDNEAFSSKSRPHSDVTKSTSGDSGFGFS